MTLRASPVAQQANNPGRASSFSPRLGRRPIAYALAGQKCRRRESAGGPYRSLSCLSVARQPCCSRAHRVDSSDAAPHTLRSPDPDSTPDVWQLVGCRCPALCLLVMYTEDAPIEISASLPVGCGVLRAETLNHEPNRVVRVRERALDGATPPHTRSWDIASY